MRFPGARCAGVLGMTLALVVVDGASTAVAPTAQALPRTEAPRVSGLPAEPASARLTGYAVRWAGAQHEEAVAVGRAALAAARAVQDTAPEVVEEGVRTDLAAAAAELEAMVEPATSTLRPGTAPGAMAADTAVPRSTAAARTEGHLERAAEVDAAATRVFRISLEVEAAVEAAAVEADGPDLALDDLETAVLAAQQAAESFAAAPREAPDARYGSGHPEGWRNGELPLDELCGVPFAPGALLRCDAADALEDLNAAYRADHGTDLAVVSAYRSLGEQAAVRLTRGALAAAPGRSNHGWGIAVDLGGFGGVGDFTDPDYLWMQENAARFGWHHPRIMEPGGGGPQEPWHWEYAGPGAAQGGPVEPTPRAANGSGNGTPDGGAEDS